MLRQLSRWILYKKLGWEKDVTIPHPAKYIICLAPHTSNWDFIIGELYSLAGGLRINFLMKKEWFFFPLGILLRRMGGIPIWRNQHTSMTDNLTNEAKRSDRFCLCITPEGTRSLNPEWKKGLYYIALGAQIPILLYGLDYKSRKIQCTKSIIPTGDVTQDMAKIKTYFKDFKGKRPEQFTVGEI